MKKNITVEGMTCGHCAMHVEEGLKELSGVKSAKVHLSTKTATIEIAQDIEDEKIKAAIEDVGYEVTKIE